MTPASPPVVSSTEIEIEAPIEAVWDILAAIERWPAWNPDVRWVTLDGPVAEGTTFVRVDKGRPFVYAASVCGAIVLRGERIGASFRKPQTAA
jgi:uncharacterized protein YndB with AHSA1/START domain